MPQTLCVEGPDRDRLVAEIRATYGQAITITAMTRVRRGGVLGFFSHEVFRISFELADPVVVSPMPSRASIPLPLPVSAPLSMPSPVSTPVRTGGGRHRAPGDTADPADTAGEGDALEALLYQADRGDGPLRRDDTTFATMLDSLTTPPAAAFGPPPPLRVEPPVDPIVGPVVGPNALPQAAPVRAPAAAQERSAPRPGTDARSRLEMLSGLRAVGIPVADNPKSGEVSLYRAIEAIVDELPAAPPLPSKAGDVVVVVGAPDQASPAAITIAARLHLGAESVWRSGPAPGYDRVIAGPMEAASRLPQLRAGATPVVVAVELEGGHDESRFGWAPQLVAALQPDAVWAAVDAGRKVEDLRAELSALGPIDALIVSGASRTASPATVWDLDIPVGVIDGRTATAGTWAGLLFDALRAAS